MDSIRKSAAAGFGLAIFLVLFSTTYVFAAGLPNELAYTPDDVALDQDGDTVYLLSAESLAIFRWSISEQRYVEPIALTDEPSDFAYSAAHNRIYLTYPGRVVFIDLETFDESNFWDRGVSLISDAGDFLLARISSGSWGSFHVFEENGNELYSRDWIHSTDAVTWSEAYNRIYYLRGGSPRDLIVQSLNPVTGELGYDWDSPYHSSDGWLGPVSVSENGKFIAVGTGRIVDRRTLSEVVDLTPGDSNSTFGDLVWFQGNVFTLSSIEGNAQLERWDVTFANVETSTQQFVGEPIALLPVKPSDQLLVIVSDNELPQFHLLGVTEDDFDGDGVLDSQDALPTDSSESQDTDDDGTGNNLDDDDDGDGVLDGEDLYPLDASESRDTDGDGAGDNADSDADNDGFNDAEDFYPADPTRHQFVASDFLPLFPGSYWQYGASWTETNATAEVGSSLNISGQSIFPLSFASGVSFYLSVSGNDIRFYGLELPAIQVDSESFTADVRLTDGFSVLQEGNFSGSGQVIVTPQYGNQDITWKADIEDVDFEVLVIDAVTYDTLHTSIGFRAEAEIDGAEVDLAYDVEYWFAEGIGIVQIEENLALPVEVKSYFIAEPSDTASESSGGGGSIGLLSLVMMTIVLMLRRKLLQKRYIF